MNQANIIVLDLEVLNSPEWCKHCLQESLAHEPLTGACRRKSIGQTFSKIGWEDYNLLGIAIGCYYDYQDDRYHYFDSRDLERIMTQFLQRKPLMVSFNGKHFDFPLMATCLQSATTADTWAPMQRPWASLIESSYDILYEIWQVDPITRFHTGNGLDAISQANGYGAKEMHGAYAPVTWRTGRYVEVVEYCTGDVWKTKKLFEQAGWGEPIRRPAGAVRLPLPRTVPLSLQVGQKLS